MGKTKKAGGAKGKLRLPKEIAGFKLPKELRKSGDALIEKANSPEGRQAIASGLAMVGGLVAANAARKQAAAAATPAPEATKPEPAAAKTAEAPPAPGKPGIDPQHISDQIGAAADMLLGRIFAKR